MGRSAGSSPGRRSRSSPRRGDRAGAAQASTSGVRRRVVRAARIAAAIAWHRSSSPPGPSRSDRVSIERSMTGSASGSTTSMKCSPMPRRCVREARRRRSRPAGVRTASAPRASVRHVSRSTSPSATSRSIEPRHAALAEEHAVGQLAHPDASLGRVGDGQQSVVLGQRQVVLERAAPRRVGARSGRGPAGTHATARGAGRCVANGRVAVVWVGDMGRCYTLAVRLAGS